MICLTNKIDLEGAFFMYNSIQQFNEFGVKEIEKVYKRDKDRKKKYNIERKGDKNTILTTCGEVSYQRTYFKSKETGIYEYLADKAVGVTRNMRKSEDVSIKAIENATDMSYRLSGC